MIEAIPENQREFDPEDIPPEKVASVAAYLFSDGATDVTGCTIRAAGNEISVVSNPEIVLRAYNDDGWSIEDFLSTSRLILPETLISISRLTGSNSDVIFSSKLHRWLGCRLSLHKL
jgi:hypothetical protein